MISIINDFPPIALDYHPHTVKAGQKASLMFTLNIPDGFHIMAHKPAEEFLIPTQLSLYPVEGVIVGQPSYPVAKEERVSWSETILLTYEGQITITVPIDVSARASGTLAFAGVLSFQGCPGNQCLPPKQQRFEISLEITA